MFTDANEYKAKHTDKTSSRFLLQVQAYSYITKAKVFAKLSVTSSTVVHSPCVDPATI